MTGADVQRNAFLVSLTVKDLAAAQARYPKPGFAAFADGPDPRPTP
jgi:hypothetical protein